MKFWFGKGKNSGQESEAMAEAKKAPPKIIIHSSRSRTGKRQAENTDADDKREERPATQAAVRLMPLSDSAKPSNAGVSLRPVAQSEPTAEISTVTVPPKRSDASGNKPPVSLAPPAKKEKAQTAPLTAGIPVRPQPDQRALYYQLMNGLYDAIALLDDKGFVVDINTRFTELLGFERDETWDMPISQVITGMSSQMLAHLKHSLAENHRVILDARCTARDGATFTAEIGVSLFSLTQGGNIALMIRNVERRKKAMDELRRAQAAFEIALAATFACDTDGLFLTVNQTFLDSFSIPNQAATRSLRFMDLLPDASGLFLRAACGEQVRDKLKISLPDGEGLTLDIALAPLMNGKVIAGVAGSLVQC